MGFSWVIHADGSEIGSGSISLPSISTQSSYNVDWKSGLWYSLWTSSTAEEIFLTLIAKVLHQTRWLDVGHVVSSAQFQLPAKRETSPHVSTLVNLICYMKHPRN